MDRRTVPWAVIDSYSDNRIRKFGHEINKGYLVTYNYLLTLATGSLITCQDADDWSDKQLIEAEEEVFRKFPDVSLCASMDQYFVMDVLSNFKGYAINRYLYFGRFNPTSNHRTLDYSRKLTVHEAFLLLKSSDLQQERTG